MEDLQAVELSDQLSVRVHHRQVADVIVQHDLERLGELICGLDRRDLDEDTIHTLLEHVPHQLP